MNASLETTTKIEYQCEHCQRVFQREQSLVAHSCEPKRRFLERNDIGVQLGLRAYQRFYQKLQGPDKVKDWKSFATSSYYRAFVKFGQYCQSTRTINVPRFIDWLVDRNEKIDRWCSDRVYEQYLIDLVVVEAAEDAVARALAVADDWAEKTQNPSHDFLRYGNRNAVCHAVVSGRVTAWVLYNTMSGAEFLNDLDAGQVALIWPYINTDLWQQRLQDHADQASRVRAALTQAGW